jgi:acyl carrier protein phosphodiesterase
MSDNPETNLPHQDTPEELAEVIAELEQYRERLVNDTMTMAQKAKVLKAKMMASLEPDLQKIDASLQELRDRYAAVTAKN